MSKWFSTNQIQMLLLNEHQFGIYDLEFLEQLFDFVILKRIILDTKRPVNFMEINMVYFCSAIVALFNFKTLIT
jgi:hypothetical protein